MKFKEWLKITEAKGGRMRAKSTDISNLAIGKIGPYGTFGSKDAPGLAQTAVGHLVGGFSSSLKDELGPIDTFPHILPLDLKGSEWGLITNWTMPLQAPSINNQLLPNAKLPESHNQITNIKYVRSFVPDPMNDLRVRKDFSQKSGAFDLYTEELESQSQRQITKFLSENFTIALAAITVSNEIKKQKDATSVGNRYDIENPTVSKKSLVESGDYFYIKIEFVCKNKKTRFEDEGRI